MEANTLATALEPVELDQLRGRWGATPLRRHHLDVQDPFLTGENQMLVSDRRRAEVCYVMYRQTPADGVLLHIKAFYPNDAFRLPTGGIHQGEGVLETLAREITEETGLRVGEKPDQVRVEKFMGVTAYALAHRQLGRTLEFATYHFLVAMPPEAELAPQDPSEQIAGWRWCPAGKLNEVADRLDQVGTATPRWADWGRYRALSHRFVAGALAG